MTWGMAAPAARDIKITNISASGNFTFDAKMLYAEVEILGGGGGGGGSGAAGAAGGNGGNTTFDSITCNGGTGGPSATNSLGGAGGTGGAGAADITIPGQRGGSVGLATTTVASWGADSIYGGGGAPGLNQNSPGNAATNWGAGGSGATTSGVVNTGTGGGSGEYKKKIYRQADAGTTKVVTIGAAGTAGTGTQLGGVGFQGIVIVTEYLR